MVHKISNSRPRVGANEDIVPAQAARLRLQLTPPRGGEHDGLFCYAYFCVSNSRPRVGANSKIVQTAISKIAVLLKG